MRSIAVWVMAGTHARTMGSPVTQKQHLTVQAGWERQAGSWAALSTALAPEGQWRGCVHHIHSCRHRPEGCHSSISAAAYRSRCAWGSPLLLVGHRKHHTGRTTSYWDRMLGCNPVTIQYLEELFHGIWWDKPASTHALNLNTRTVGSWDRPRTSGNTLHRQCWAHSHNVQSGDAFVPGDHGGSSMAGQIGLSTTCWTLRIRFLSKHGHTLKDLGRHAMTGLHDVGRDAALHTRTLDSKSAMFTNSEVRVDAQTVCRLRLRWMHCRMMEARNRRTFAGLGQVSGAWGLQPEDSFDLGRCHDPGRNNIVFAGHMPRLFANSPYMPDCHVVEHSAIVCFGDDGYAFAAHWTSNVRRQGKII